MLCIHAFKHNLLSVNKLCHDEKCSVVFHESYCIIQDKDTNEVRGIGKGENGLYYLINEPMKKILKDLNAQTLNVTKKSRCHMSSKMAMSVNVRDMIRTVITNVPKINKETLWHQRLGHAPMKRIKLI